MTDNKALQKQQVILGKVSGVHGVRGGLKVYSYSRPIENIFSYDPLLLLSDSGSESKSVLEWRQQGKGLVVFFDGVDDRNTAENLVGRDIAVERDKLPKLDEGQYYWFDLLGSEVVNLADECLGLVNEIKETGANDVLVVKGDKQYLIPFLTDSVIKEVDPEGKRILVDWDGEYI